MRDFAVVGKSLPRLDGPSKVSGEAVYAGDIKLPGMLYGAIVRSPLPSARIIRINYERALQLPGVKAVVTGQDTLGKTIGPLRFKAKFMDEYPLAMDRVRYIGEPVAAVAAIDEDTAQEALGLIEVEYQQLPAVLTVEEALAEGAPLVHEDMPGNISRKILFDIGDIEQAWENSDAIREDTFTTVCNTHAPMEPHACVASYAAGRVTLWSSTQVPNFLKSDLAYTLGLPQSAVRVIMPCVGGGFGGKADGLYSLDFCAALLSRATGKPVAIKYTREEEFIKRKRHAATVYLKTGIKKDGTITGRLGRCTLDGGAYQAFGPATILLTGIFLNLPYRYQAFKFEGTRIFTNNPVSSAMRGHGAPQVQFGSDMQLDLLAAEIGMDPVDVRLQNALETGEVTLNGFKIYSSGFREAIEKVVAESGWRERKGKLPPNRGLGIGCSGFPSGTGFRQRPDIPTYSSAMVRLSEDGSIILLVGAADTGQGSDLVMVQIAAEELGIQVGDVRLVRPDTDLTPADMGSYSSRETVFSGNAVLAASRKVKDQVLEHASHRLEAAVEDLIAREGQIFVKGSPDRGMTFAEAAIGLIESRKGEPVVGEGTFDPPDKINYATYTFGAQVAEVEVDPATGSVRVLKVTTAHDSGQPINPMAVEGQLEGSIHMGLGFTLSEELFIEEGQILNPSLGAYAIPVASQMPEVKVVHVTSNDPQGPYGAKESGEGTLGPTAPAIANAIYDAVGIHFKSLPITPAKVLEGLRRRQTKQDGR